MFIVMHCIGMPFNGSTIQNESLGGSETAAYYVAKELADAGHSVTIFTTHEEEGVWDGVRYLNVGERTEQTPLGFNFHFYASNTPHDVLIIQRDPTAFRYKWASKINLWWVHDLALFRTKQLVTEQMWNIDAVLTVSDYHTAQICSVYDIDPSICFNIKNAVDSSLFKTIDQNMDFSGKKQLLYSSRPERGLENLVKKGGIMEMLGEDYELSVCAYENVTQEMVPYYEHLYGLAGDLPNVKILGALSKPVLADLMCESDLLIYPTIFEEVSCITAMEAMAAGLPMLTSSHAALPETCKDSGTVLMLVDEALAICEDFAISARSILNNPEYHSSLRNQQLAKSEDNTWVKVADRLLECVGTQLLTYSSPSKAKLAVDNSDITMLLDNKPSPLLLDPIETKILADVDLLYSFAKDKDFANHYAKIYKRFPETRYEENLEGNIRFETVSNFCTNLSSGDVVLDYGCAHGHYAINLARRFPEIKFVGFDISEENIKFAKVWAEKEGLKNVRFAQSFWDEGNSKWISDASYKTSSSFALIIMAEVLEHVANPAEVFSAVCELAKTGTQVVITTPYGPWEAQQYKERYGLREHLHQFERSDLHNLFGHNIDFAISVVPAGFSKSEEPMGSYITSFKFNLAHEVGALDYCKKALGYVGKPTISLCMIAFNAETIIAKAIESAVSIVDEVIINVDENTTDNTYHVIQKLKSKHKDIQFLVNYANTPLEIGFSAARNATIKKATGDWILWLDTDEVLVNPKKLVKYLRNNQYAGLAIKQHHFSVEPLGVLKTDMPVKIFRNNRGVKFFGFVHEHPETEMNKGVGYVWVVPDVEIIHDSYITEEIRRQRFARNIGLMERDRRENPERVLGKFLWVRDLTQSIKFELEQQVPINESMCERATEGIKLWAELLKENTRMASEALEYYSTLVMVLRPNSAVDYSFSLQIAPATGNIDTRNIEQFTGTFYDTEQAISFFKKIQSEKMKNIGSKYS